MFKRAAVAVVFLASALACGGAGGGSTAATGSAVGPYATSMAEHYVSQSNGIPCPTYNVGEEFSIQDFSVRIDKVELLETKAGGNALGVTSSWRNDSPLKTTNPLEDELYTSDGAKGRGLISKEANDFRAARGIVPGGLEYTPGQWTPSGTLYSIGSSDGEGAVIYVFHSVQEFDPTDASGRRKIQVLKGHAVVDLGTPLQP